MSRHVVSAPFSFSPPYATARRAALPSPWSYRCNRTTYRALLCSIGALGRCKVAWVDYPHRQAILGQNRAGGKIVTTLPRGALGKSQPWSLEPHIAGLPTLINAKSL
jgi:hypothetical protein